MAKLIIELRGCECRWPAGRDALGRHVFCAAATPDLARAYCDEHHAIAYISAATKTLAEIDEWSISLFRVRIRMGELFRPAWHGEQTTIPVDTYMRSSTDE